MLMKNIIFMALKASDIEITGIKHIDQNQNHANVSFIDGGIGHQFVEVHITSQPGYLIDSTLLFYTNVLIDGFSDLVFQNESIFKNYSVIAISQDDHGNNGQKILFNQHYLIFLFIVCISYHFNPFSLG